MSNDDPLTTNEINKLRWILDETCKLGKDYSVESARMRALSNSQARAKITEYQSKQQASITAAQILLNAKMAKWQD